MRSCSSVARSREIRRRSSSLGLGGTRHGADPRLASLPGDQGAQQRLAVDRIRLGAPVASWHGNRRRIDDVALDAVGLEQAMNPETIEPTSWIATTLTGAAIRCSALVFNRARRSSSSRPLPPASVCLDIFLLPGASDVATHVERLSSNETNKVAQSPGMPVRSGTGKLVPSCIGRSLNSVVGDVDLPEFVAPPA